MTHPALADMSAVLLALGASGEACKVSSSYEEGRTRIDFGLMHVTAVSMLYAFPRARGQPGQITPNWVA
jgi:hypothetical protein